MNETFKKVVEIYEKVLADIQFRLAAFEKTANTATSSAILSPTIGVSAVAGTTSTVTTSPVTIPVTSTGALNGDTLNGGGNGNAATLNIDNHDENSSENTDGNLLMIQYNDMMDLLAATWDLSNETSSTFLSGKGCWKTYYIQFYKHAPKVYNSIGQAE